MRKHYFVVHIDARWLVIAGAERYYGRQVNQKFTIITAKKPVCISAGASTLTFSCSAPMKYRRDNELVGKIFSLAGLLAFSLHIVSCIIYHMPHI